MQRDDRSLRAVGPAAPSSTVQMFAGLISGVLVLGVGGALVGAVMAATMDGKMETLVALGGGVGAFIGLLLGRRLAYVEKIWVGALTGAVLPLLLILLGALRSGRLFDAQPEDFADPKALMVLIGAPVVGGLLGASLIGLKKLLVRLFAGGGRSEG
jgi:hypothetical protein